MELQIIQVFLDVAFIALFILNGLMHREMQKIVELFSQCIQQVNKRLLDYERGEALKESNDKDHQIPPKA
jgi:hypothetical protein